MKRQLLFWSLLSVFLVSVNCVPIRQADSPWTEITIADIGLTCFKKDESEKLQCLLDNGLSLNNIYDSYGNSNTFRHPEQWYPGRTLLLEALYSHATNCVDLLLSRGADVSAVDQHGNNALIMLGFVPGPKSKELAADISAKSSFDVNATNAYGMSALTVAIASGNIDYASWLIEMGADVNLKVRVSKSHRCFRPTWFYSLNAENRMFDFIIMNAAVDFNALDTKGRGAVYWLDPKLSDYNERLNVILRKRAGVSDSIMENPMKENGGK